MSRDWAPENGSHTPHSVPNRSGTLSRFLAEADDRLAWFETQLALLASTSPDYESEKRAIHAASAELRALVRHATERARKS